ncbi:hypothetical protein BCR34DRAFT_556281 [Clohesyomyces aquaticus]|uniref:Uncharacterized protein n=1 Tax=Clohesyomyces aquaticus TaxID=1231657 RepID=A0A1Y2A3R7_9PLEO|nr:hypothetical protein BCR34DRAFT_556281 [Clohesyomyces aquaticus]
MPTSANIVTFAHVVDNWHEDLLPDRANISAFEVLDSVGILSLADPEGLEHPNVEVLLVLDNGPRKFIGRTSLDRLLNLNIHLIVRVIAYVSFIVTSVPPQDIFSSDAVRRGRFRCFGNLTEEKRVAEVGPWLEKRVSSENHLLQLLERGEAEKIERAFELGAHLVRSGGHFPLPSGRLRILGRIHG